MPGRFITDRQHEDYMTLRRHHTQKIAAAKAGFSASTGARIDHDPRPPSRKRRERRHAGGKPDPLTGLWDEEIVPLLGAKPGLLRLPFSRRWSIAIRSGILLRRGARLNGGCGRGGPSTDLSGR